MTDHNKCLILLTDNYPLSDGEFFIDDEIKYISENISKTYILVPEPRNFSKNKIKRFVPGNVQVTPYSSKITFFDKIKLITFTLKKDFRKEYEIAIKKVGKEFRKKIFKIMFMDIVKARKLKKIISGTIKENKLNEDNIIFYSYWNDYKALCLALLKSENKNLRTISRAHGWDVFADRHKVPYLPFKNFILTNLDFIYSISQAGKNELSSYLYNNTSLHTNTSKIKVCRLGKSNLHKPNNIITDNYILCSCSNIIALKRIDLLIDILAELRDLNISWIHFGDGPLKEHIKKYAEKNISCLEFEFKGNITNSQILEFYNKNHIHLFLNLSESEGIPVSIMEALSSGIPVFATNVGGTNEIVNEKNGFLVDKYPDIKKSAYIIRKYLTSTNDNKLRYRNNAYEFWKKNYNAEKNYSNFVNEIINFK